jgi:membrane-bound ClpP family serine protease
MTFQKLDGRKVDIDGKKVVLPLKGNGAETENGFREKILATLTDPNIAYILMMLGVAGLYFELAHPGAYSWSNRGDLFNLGLLFISGFISQLCWYAFYNSRHCFISCGD